MAQVSGSAERCSAGAFSPISIIGWLRSGGSGRAWLARAVFILMFTLLVASAGCGVVTYRQTDFPEAFVNADGKEVVWDQVVEILTDTQLDDDAKREKLRNELRIEDEDLIDAFLAIPPAQLT